MLRITIPAMELFDERKQEFINTKEQTLQLEHSLVSLSKWESKWCKSFISTPDKTDEEIKDYIKCMTLTQNVPDNIYEYIPNSIIEEIVHYINAPMTATTIREDKNSPKNREIVTAELIYYWMISFGIPWECQKWHINRLITLIKVCGIKNTPPKKQSKSSIASEGAALNAARKKQHTTRG